MISQARSYHFPEGELLLIDKPREWTSFDVVNKIRYAVSRYSGIKKIKVGHAGTLDPLATGLLIVCTGKFTKKINELQLMHKEYTGTFLLGATTPSFDRETEEDEHFGTVHITEDLIRQTAAQFLGTIQQVPPVYSAIKVAGTRAYQMARNNDTVNLPPRAVTIREFEITGIELPRVHFRVSCSKGTYIRALARDFGAAMDSGGYLYNLRRTKIGDYTLEEGMTLVDFLAQLTPGE